MNTTELAHFESLYPENTREREITKIIELVKSGTSCQLIGLPGAGRSNILELLAYNKNVRLKHLGQNAQWVHFVYMDFSEARRRSLHEVITFILSSLSYSLAERELTAEKEAVSAFLKEAVAFQDEIILFQALKKSIDYLAIQKELSVILLFDRFDQYIPDITDQFFINLKVLRNRAKYRFSAVFSLERPLEDILEPALYSDFYEFLTGNNIFVSLFDPVGLEFRAAYLQKVTGKKLSGALKDEIVRLTGGHGKLTRIALETALAEGASESELEKTLLDKNQIKGALFEIWNSLRPEEQKCVKNPVKNISPYLEQVGLLKNGALTIPLLATYIKNIPPGTETKILYDPARNDILKNGKSITELLSPSEFRLLRFLIQNSDRVSEKEEIITAVWRETKTQEGVTDQALDQIIYRLRKKIEDDPNQPRFIQTIKGRGYRFSP